ncbi:MAG: J domain-containing protein [Clostridia bacterium]|nr:J domain-containing protein [Clostridia bacterium]
MEKDPYKVLGVDPAATDEEIKKVYRELVRKYHPDNYANTPLADLANEKMQEINAAYDEIQQLRKAEAQRASYDTTGNSSYGGYQQYTGSSDFADIRACISVRNFAEADIRLNAVHAADRNAEWFYLKGVVFRAKGWYFEASKYFDNAYRMEPSNMEYRNAAESIRNYTSSVNQGRSTDDAICNLCSTLICADCCCEMCGGDLVPCC